MIIVLFCSRHKIYALISSLSYDDDGNEDSFDIMILHWNALCMLGVRNKQPKTPFFINDTLNYKRLRI